MPGSVENEPVSYEKAVEELQYLMDVPLEVTVQLGERRMNIRDILQLQTGSIIDLPKSAGENVDILINGQTVAFGEVMELDGATGIRVMDLNVSN